MRFRFCNIFVLATLASALSVPAAHAAIVTDALNTIDYNNGEVFSVYTPTATGGTYSSVQTGVNGLPIVAVGDHLYGISATTNETAAPGGVQTPNGSTVFDLVIAKMINPLTGADITTPGYTGQVELLFTSDSATGGFLTGTGSTYTLADGSTVTGLGATAQTLDALYQGSTLTASTIGTGTQAQGIAAASDGTLYGNFGYGAALTSASPTSQWGASGVGYWASDVYLTNGEVNPVLSASVPYVTGLQDLSPNNGFVPLQNLELSLSQGGELTGTDTTQIHNNAIVVGTTGFDLVGGGHAFTGTGNGAWASTSVDPFQVYPTPEPGTILMIGMGVAFGLPCLRRRRKTNG